jgi:hypothetical protein
LPLRQLLDRLVETVDQLVQGELRPDHTVAHALDFITQRFLVEGQCLEQQIAVTDRWVVGLYI